MIDRHELTARVEVVDGVPALAHEVGDEAVGVGDRHLRPVDEAALHLLPLLRCSAARGVAERVQVELVVAGLALAEVTLGVAAPVGAVDGAVVLGTEARPAGGAGGDGSTRPR